jgi:hypothetical protein
MNDSIRAFFACFQSTYEPVDDNSLSRTISVAGTLIKNNNTFFSLSIKGSSVNRTNSSASPHGHNKNTGSTDGDEFCRITIDSLTNSYKIGSPVKPRSQNGRQIRSTSHSLLTAPYMEGK